MAGAREEHRAGRLTDARSLRRRMRHRNGRLWLLVSFLVLRPTDLLLFKVAHSELILAGTIIASCWTTGLLAAVWLRVPWARYALIVGLPLCALVALLTTVVSEAQLKVRLALLAAAAAHLIATLILARSAAIKDLVSRAKD